ncbi:MAG: hypothetical protein KDC23_11925 [Actinobacteria bacterium]|nr:hypothetical protein [Actinomycetota bacterium]
MSEEVHDNHGQTPAAWTAVTIIMVAFAVGCLAVVLAMPWLFWVSVVFVFVGIGVGKVMSMMGYGAKPEESPAEQSAASGQR